MAAVRVSGWVVPILIVLAAAAGVGGARLFAAPSYERVFERNVKAVRPETARFVIRGLRCVDTARTVANQIGENPGVLRYVAYASRNEAQVTFDAATVDPSVIKEAIEGPVFDEQTGQILFHQYEVVSIDGNKIR
jgi:copper chaperone CopZ